jgi:hypothetical protein
VGEGKVLMMRRSDIGSSYKELHDTTERKESKKSRNPVDFLKVKVEWEKEQKKAIDTTSLLEQTNNAKWLADRLTATAGDLNDTHVNDLIEKTDQVKHGIKESKPNLGLSKKEYERLRKGYNEARDAWKLSQEGHIDYSQALMAGMAGMGGYVSSYPSEAMRKTPGEIEAARRRVVREAHTFLNAVEQHIQTADPFTDSHGVEEVNPFADEYGL